MDRAICLAVEVDSQKISKVTLHCEVQSDVSHVLDCLVNLFFTGSCHNAVINIQYVEHVVSVQNAFVVLALLEPNPLEFFNQVPVPHASCLFLTISVAQYV